MATIQATPRLYPTLGSLADLLTSSYSPERTQQMQGLMRFLEVPAIARTLDRISYGEPLTTGAGMTTEMRPDTKSALLSMLGAVPVGRAVEPAAMAAGQAAERVAERVVPQVLDRGGLGREMLLGMGQGTRSYAYRPNPPSKRDPVVGTRFERENLGGMADRTYVDPETLRGSSILAMPWDSTNRNYLIKSISDVELPSSVLTSGGQDYARDVNNLMNMIGGASNEAIAKRIVDRAKIAQAENLAQGGTGRVIYAPSTMGAYGENFSTMPTNILLGLVDTAKLNKREINNIDKSIRNFKVAKQQTKKVDGKEVTKRVVTQPFKDFKGVMTEAGRLQLASKDAGELRKALVNRLYLKNQQRRLGFNEEDLIASITDPNIAGVPKGYIGNTLIEALPARGISPSAHPSYSHDFGGTYGGSLLQSIPIEVAMPKAYKIAAEENMGKKGSLRNMAIGALEKKKSGAAEFVDDQTINAIGEYLRLNR